MTEPYAEESLPYVIASTSTSLSVVTFWLYYTLEPVDHPYFVPYHFLPVFPFFVLTVESVAVLPVAAVAFFDVFEISIC